MEFELAFAVLARAERVGNFDGAQLALRGRDDVEQDLEALGREFRREFLEAVAADMKKPLMGSATSTRSASGDLRSSWLAPRAAC